MNMDLRNKFFTKIFDNLRKETESNIEKKFFVRPQEVFEIEIDNISIKYRVIIKETVNTVDKGLYQEGGTVYEIDVVAIKGATMNDIGLILGYFTQRFERVAKAIPGQWTCEFKPLEKVNMVTVVKQEWERDNKFMKVYDNVDK